jgi:hypothetical protein
MIQGILISTINSNNSAVSSSPIGLFNLFVGLLFWIFIIYLIYRWWKKHGHDVVRQDGPRGPWPAISRVVLGYKTINKPAK